ncbi:translation machinery-associated protein 7-like protein [Pyrus ussuriensis x Pyrus communis]|uniref:Translation machinery-associated protein 7-like protein n=1 Tax=Pyrus ussuriensis x Pyrus communis TaxID=2448454 RepID=A0A5N5FR21_9ROSA|nr:translation machinery-associated protein 7-like protein [Pyrus ussuriensis x Pyrus communis]
MRLMDTNIGGGFCTSVELDVPCANAGQDKPCLDRCTSKFPGSNRNKVQSRCGYVPGQEGWLLEYKKWHSPQVKKIDPTKHRWNKPDDGWSKRGGVGVVIRSSGGVFTAALSRTVRAATSARHMELLGARGGIAKPLEAPEVEKEEYDESDLANLQKEKDEEKALKELGRV